LTDQISAFEQSLSRDKHRTLTMAFMTDYKRDCLHELEYSVQPSLLANVETTLELVTAAEGMHVQPMVVDGLIGRYQGVLDLIEQPKITRQRRIEASVDAIMVIPTLAYYAGVLAEKVRPLPDFPTVVENGQ